MQDDDEKQPQSKPKHPRPKPTSTTPATKADEEPTTRRPIPKGRAVEESGSPDS
jgi:hypothetical protein